MLIEKFQLSTMPKKGFRGMSKEECAVKRNEKRLVIIEVLYTKGVYKEVAYKMLLKYTLRQKKCSLQQCVLDLPIKVVKGIS